MIERLLAGDAALGRGELDAAERLFRQVVEADPRNGIAVVGLARVALSRGDRKAARAEAERALAIDPDEAAATRLLVELDQAVEPEPDSKPEPASVAAQLPAPTPPDRRGWRGWLARLLRRR